MAKLTAKLEEQVPQLRTEISSTAVESAMRVERLAAAQEQCASKTVSRVMHAPAIHVGCIWDCYMPRPSSSASPRR